MSNILANNWENHFKDHLSNEASNKTMSELFLSFATRSTVANCLKAAIEEKPTLFMVRIPNPHHVLFLHNFTKLGGTRTNPDIKLFALVGTGTTAYPAHVTQETMFQDTDIQVPTWTQFNALTNADDVNTMTTRANSAAKHVRPCCPIPPFLATILVNQGGMSIPDLILATMARIRSYDAEHADDEAFEKADTHCQALVHWLFAANDKTVGAISTIPSIDNVIIAKAKEIHADAILTPEITFTPPDSIANNEAIS